MKKTQHAKQKQRVSGVILIDKPKGMTSQQVVSKVKYLFQSPQHDSRKAGHTGTLDPMATGLLPICLGEATKFSHYQLDANKSYEAVIKLGQQTDTGDAEGTVIYECALPHWQAVDLLEITQQFLGKQQQIPPMYSALKKDGKKLYEYAREGIEIERPSRAITIFSLQLQQLSVDSMRLEVTCSKGTYIRVLGEDIAKALGSVGHLISLRRSSVGSFDVTQAIDLAQLAQLNLQQRFERLLPSDACIEDVPTLTLSSEQCERLRLGQRLNVIAQMNTDIDQYLSAQNKLVTIEKAKSQTDDSQLAYDIRLLNEAGEFVGLGALSRSGRLQPKKMLNL
ncbi:tRNA pseudouridine(55) synthase TruB [Psychrobacter sp. I-STPA10]|uniref:tRNA pseudouridine(55) synthase TruB n=1 Tax=Psychrobacter sp. I-STPA10 TaxID=2585769 RepID=UPI001E2A52F8|nr:tRNA pseudouridine(55) synthase TruB [Psychrobacter sp. I-STPA10]